MDYGSQRNKHFKITVGNNDDGINNAACVNDGGDTTGKKMIVNKCDPPIAGRYVHVILKGANRILQLCEVLVYEADLS